MGADPVEMQVMFCNYVMHFVSKGVSSHMKSRLVAAAFDVPHHASGQTSHKLQCVIAGLL